MHIRRISLLVGTALIGSFIGMTAAHAQQMDNTYSYSTSVTETQAQEIVPEAGIVRTETSTTTLRMGDAPTLKEELPSRHYNHEYYTYSEKYKAPAIRYGGIEEPVVIDNGADLTPIRTLSR